VTPQPPRLAERLVTWSLFPPDREAVLGDLQEEFATLADKSGDDAAWRWYWTQALASIGPNVLRRIRGSYELRRLAESDADRLMRKSARTLSLWLIGAPLVLSAWMLWDGEKRLSVFALLLIAESVALSFFFSTRLPRKPVDRRTAIVRSRRSSAVFGVIFAAGALRVFFVPQPYRHFVSDAEWFLVPMILLWPKRYWPVKPRYLGPEIPQAPTPFVIGVAADGPQFLTVDIPSGPASVGNLILARTRDARIVIDRLFAERDGLRLFAIVSGGATAAIDLLDADGRVVRTTNVPLERAAWSSDDARQLDITVPLEQLAAGSYRVRVSVDDAPDAGAREAAFRIRD
jgi:hypothetical protein